MRSKYLLYILLAAGITLFCFLLCSWTILTTTKTVVYSGEGTYSGQFKGKVFHGKGKWESELGAVYEGEFRYGNFHGQGKLTFINGANYTGEFKNGYMHGHGVMTFPDGHTHEGYWDADEFQGEHEDCDHDHE